LKDSVGSGPAKPRTAPRSGYGAGATLRDPAGDPVRHPIAAWPVAGAAKRL